MLLFARIRDAAKAAWAVLWGRTEVQLRMARIEREWVGIELEVSAMFDNVNALVARLAKRQRRDAPEAETAALVTPPAEPLGLGKVAIRRRVREAQNRSSRVTVATPSSHQEKTA
jgi:hypothetical protein